MSAWQDDFLRRIGVDPDAPDQQVGGLLGLGPVGRSTVDMMSNPDPSFSPVVDRATLTPQAAIGLLGRRGPVTAAELPAAEQKAQTMVDYGMAVAGATAPVGPWAAAKAGEPTTLLGWRGGSGGNALSEAWQAKLGRPYLLDEGYYVAPTKGMAERWGSPSQNRVEFQKPYVMESASPNDIAALDIPTLKAQGYDGLIVKGGSSGSSLGNEKMAQAVAWPPTTSRVVENAGRRTGEFEIGAVLDLHPTNRLVQEAVADTKQAKVVGFSPWGHPEVKIGGKRISLNPSDYTLNPNYALLGMLGGGGAAGLLGHQDDPATDKETTP
jgi:hypothetical protein